MHHILNHCNEQLIGLNVKYLVCLNSGGGGPLTLPSGLLRTKDTMMTLLSRPWYLSTVLTSRALKSSLCSRLEMTFSCCRYGAMTPISDALHPAYNTFKIKYYRGKKNILHVSQQIVCSDLEQQSDKGLYQYGFRVVADTTFLHRLRGGNLKKGTVHNDKMYKKQI